jgi:hypothetical protein
MTNTMPPLPYGIRQCPVEIQGQAEAYARTYAEHVTKELRAERDAQKERAEYHEQRHREMVVEVERLRASKPEPAQEPVASEPTPG